MALFKAAQRNSSKIVKPLKTPSSREFWWPKGEAALNQNWNVGDFDTWVERSGHWRAYAVEFLKADIDKLLPSPEEKHSKTTSVNLQPEGTDVIEIEYDGKLGENICSASSENIQNRNKGGRPMSDWWPDWVAELTLYLDEEGLIKESGGYKNQSKVIEDVASRLSEKANTCPTGQQCNLWSEL